MMGVTLVPSTETIEAAKERADSMRLAMLYLAEYEEEGYEKHTDEGKVRLLDAISTLSEWTVVAEDKGYETETVMGLVSLHNDTLDALDDPESVDVADVAHRYSSYYGKLANHVIHLIQKEKTDLKGRDDPTFA